jgi:excisionase family DNA binding protein
MESLPESVVVAKEDPLFLKMAAACEVAVRRVMNLADTAPRRLLSARESAKYLSLSEREVYNMLASRQLRPIKHGRRLLLDLRDLEEWIAHRKTL